MPLTLQAVVVKKPITLANARLLADGFIKKEHKGFYRETAESYRFRAIAKTKFDPNSFRTKVISPQVSLVIGKLIKV